MNRSTTKFVYHILVVKIETCLDTLRGSQYIGTLNIPVGYWQLEIDKRSRYKTVIVTNYDLFEHVRIPFGVCNSPVTFSRMVQLQGLIWEECLTYLDDVIISGYSFQFIYRS